MANTSTPGLRERKRLETRARLEAAAVSLVLSKGLENTTVEDISERADVSPRTFFNYFDSKDQAILGVLPDDASLPELAEAPGLRAEEALVPAVVSLIFTSLGAPSTAVALREDRTEIFRRYPHLLADKFTQMTAVLGRLTTVVDQLLARDPRFADLDDTGRLVQAELVLNTCGGAARLATRQWASSHDSNAGEEQLQQRAIALVHELTGRLQ